MVDDYDDDWELEIFSLKSGSWKSKLLVYEKESHLVSGERGVYWNGPYTGTSVAGSARQNRGMRLCHLICRWGNSTKLSVRWDFSGFTGDLFIFSSDPDTRIDAWITDEYGRGGSWTKWFSVDCIPASPNIPLAYTRSGKILLHNESDRVILFNPEDNNTYKDYPIGENGFIYCATYLETLISPYLGSEPSG
ncbi:hypothetical protein NL676_021121 [Syzygium grande]|nr:hypothetical protein NL676_021121 [Syzygium grande]